MKKTKRVVLVQPASTGGNFEYIAIPRQGMLFLSGALAQWEGPYQYEREIWFEDRSGLIDPEKDLDGVDILMVTALINEAPRGYQIARQAKQHHPHLITIGGGPQMGPLIEEAFDYGQFDVVVQREGEDIIGQLSDVLLNYPEGQRDKYLHKIGGISYRSEGHIVQTRRVGLVTPDFVELPDFHSIKGLSPADPLCGGVLENVRGCTENCSYCQVIQQFLGYRLVSRETELKRLAQLRRMADDGLIHASRSGAFQIFISDDLHTPPMRATKYREERLARLKGWKGHTDGMSLICQVRTEVGQDPEVLEAMHEANIKMMYVGVESNNAENLKSVRKRQEPDQANSDLIALKKDGFGVVAMTIIGLPYDTEESVMELADWITEISRYQTANLLTPLPATSNWESMTPLNEKGEILQEGEMRPYHLYTGRQLVHYDERWTMQESRELYDKFTAKLSPVDDLYARIFRILRNYRLRLASTGRDLGATVGMRIADASEALRGWSDPLSATGKDVSGSLSQRVDELVETMRSVSQPLANAHRDVADAIGTRATELAESLKSLSDPKKSGNQELAANISGNITELNEMLNGVLTEPKQKKNILE